jgi:N-acyl-D-amino-acid deacylase
MHDIIIKNGMVFDGTGDEGKVNDIAINDGMITEVGDLSGDHARELIDANGHIVAPGFIDISNRSDTRWRLFIDPSLESMLYQGVTTIIGGNSGASLAPIYNEEMMRAMRKWVDIGGININWHSVEEFFTVIAQKRTSVNFGTFVGYGTLRRGLTGDEMRTLTKEEMISIRKHMVESLEQGALGISTGMIYSHERMVSRDELLQIGMVTKKKDALFVTHMRNESDQLLSSIDESLAIQQKTGTRMHISHLKAMQKENWSLMPQAIAKIESTDVLFDIYPYTFSATVLYTFLPEWVSDGGRRMMLERLRNRKTRAAVIGEMEKGPDLSHMVVAETLHSHFFCGKTFGDIAKKQNVSVAEAVINVLLASDGRVVVFCESISEENIIRGLQSENAIISSNGAGFSIDKRTENVEHPRSFGAFPRVYTRFVREKEVIDIATMIHKSTGMVAKDLGLEDRGYIAPNMRADIIVFDPNNFADHADREQPYKYATGMQYVFVNGQSAIKYGKYTGVRSGMIIRK